MIHYYGKRNGVWVRWYNQPECRQPNGPRPDDYRDRWRAVPIDADTQGKLAVLTLAPEPVMGLPTHVPGIGSAHLGSQEYGIDNHTYYGVADEEVPHGV